jgi:signal transduction histidine kinase
MLAAHLRRASLATIYLVGGMLLAVPVAVVLSVGISVGLGMLPVFLVGLPILAATMLAWRRFAAWERERAALVLGAPIAPPPSPVRAGTGLWARLVAHVRWRTTWKELAWAVLLVPLGTLTGAAATAAWSVGVALVATPAGHLVAPDDTTLGELAWPWLVAAPIAGVAALGAAALVAEGLGAAMGALARSLLGAAERDVLAARVDTLETTRAGAVESADQMLRRIERDLHDGAQHRLSYVAMELGRARKRLAAGDAEGAAPIVDRAFEESKQAMAELRDLVRGIHPSILADRGLKDAVSGLAGRCPVPVAIDIDLPERPPATVETAAYFVVAEALTNVGRHAGASSATVTIRRDAGRLVVTVADDGHGGARVVPGGGLGGLRQRVAALDGTLEVDSPPGGGTTIRAVL